MSHQKSLAIVGIFSLAAAVLHGAWHWYFPGYPQLQAAAPAELEALQLMNGAIALFLVFMGVACLWVARSVNLSGKEVRAFALIAAGFWIGRLILEFAIPLQLPLLFIARPGSFVKLLIAIPVIVLLTPFIFGRQSRSQVA